MIKYMCKYSRRMIKVLSSRFVSDERGAVLVIFVLLALPIVQLLFLGYNAGISLTYRMRAQNVADAASYSSSVWQARFLNYCANTRRYMIANYATIALCTAYESNREILKHINHADGLLTPLGVPHRDTGTITDSLDPLLNNYYNPLIDNYVLPARESADILNQWLSDSQWILYNSVARDTKNTVMKKTVNDARRWNGTGYPDDGEFHLSEKSFGGIRIDGGEEALLERKAIPVNEISAYFDDYTAANQSVILPSSKSLGRGSINGIGSGSCFYTRWVYVKSHAVTISNNQVRAYEDVITGVYKYRIGRYCVPIPIIGGIDETTVYALRSPLDAAPVFEIREDVGDKYLEPSSLAIVEVRQDATPLVPTLGIHPSDVGKEGRFIRAFSRGKAYFRGTDENLAAGIYELPNMNYPFWGAKLAPIADNPKTEKEIKDFQSDDHALKPLY